MSKAHGLESSSCMQRSNMQHVTSRKLSSSVLLIQSFSFRQKQQKIDTHHLILFAISGEAFISNLYSSSITIRNNKVNFSDI